MASTLPTILVFAAHDPELAGLDACLGPTRDAVVQGARVVARAIGIGVPAAAVGATRLLCDVKPNAAVFVGTGGAYERSLVGQGDLRARHLALGSVIVARAVVLASSAVAEGRGAYPAPMGVRAPCDEAISAALAACADPPAARVDVATTLAVTTDDVLAQALSAAFTCAVEHLEAAAVGLACEAMGVPFAMALGIANRVGESGREEWRQNHHHAGFAAAQAVVTWLREGAAGLKRS